MGATATKHKKHRVVTVRIVVASVVVGVVLAVASVPYGTLVAELRLRGPLSRWVGDRLPGPARSAGIRWVRSYVRFNPEGSQHYLARAPMFPYWMHGSGGGEPTPVTGVPPTAARAAQREGGPMDAYWSGYPFTAAVGWWKHPGPSRTLVRWLYQSPFGHQRYIAIPLRPIWPGLLANTLFYAALTLVLLAGLRLRRTRRRRAHGRCVACGYELGEGVGVCPECGLGAIREIE